MDRDAGGGSATEDRELLLSGISNAVYASLVQVCGGEQFIGGEDDEHADTDHVQVCGGEQFIGGEDDEHADTDHAPNPQSRPQREQQKQRQGEWHAELRRLAHSTVSWTCKQAKKKKKRKLAVFDKTNNGVDNDGVNTINANDIGKPWNIEIRTAPALFHRHKDKATGILHVVSDFGLSRSIRSPHELGHLLCAPVERHCHEAGWSHHVGMNNHTSGFLCVVTVRRAEELRNAGRLPCPWPSCMQWCKGEKGVWWHQQQRHGAEHGCATAAAAAQQRGSSNALIVYDPQCKNIDPEQYSSSADSNCQEEGSLSTNNTKCSKIDRNNAGGGYGFVKKETTREQEEDPLEYVKRGDVKNLQRMIKAGRYHPNTDVDPKTGASALQWAAGGGHLEMVAFLVERCGCDVGYRQKGKRSFSGRTALHWAARNGHLDIVKYLVLGNSTDVEAATADGTTAFCWAAWQGHLHVLQFLYSVAGCNPRTVNSFGCNAVLWCAQGTAAVSTKTTTTTTTTTPMTATKKRATTTIAEEKNNEGDRTLVGPTTVDVMEWLEVVAGCSIHVLNSNGHGVLHKASQRGRRDLCDWYLSKLLNARQLEIPCRESQNNAPSTTVTPPPATTASEETRTGTDLNQICSFLEAVGPDSDGCTPSDLAGMEGHVELALHLAEQERQLVQRAAFSGCESFPKWLSLHHGSENIIANNTEGSDDSRSSSLPFVANVSLTCRAENVWEPWAGIRRMRETLTSSSISSSANNSVPLG